MEQSPYDSSHWIDLATTYVMSCLEKAGINNLHGKHTFVDQVCEKVRTRIGPLKAV